MIYYSRTIGGVQSDKLDTGGSIRSGAGHTGGGGPPIDNIRADDPIAGRLKRSNSYHADYGEKTYAEIKRLAEQGDRAARQMKKLIEQAARLVEKLRQK
jgi:hypothetical protein